MSYCHMYCMHLVAPSNMYQNLILFNMYVPGESANCLKQKEEGIISTPAANSWSLVYIVIHIQIYTDALIIYLLIKLEKINLESHVLSFICQ